MNYLLEFLLTLISVLLTLLIVKYFNDRRATNLSVPQASAAWPLIGHLHLFGGQKLIHNTLGALADEHGAIFTIKLGSHRALVLSSWEITKEIFTTHDRVFSSRPRIAASKLLGYDYAMFGFAPYGSYWRDMRKIATVELLSNHRIHMLKHTRVPEVESAIRELYKTWFAKGDAENGVLVDMKQWFGNLTHNIAVKMVAGKRYFGPNADFEEEEASRYKKVMRDFADLFGLFVLSDALPFLGWLDFSGYEKTMKKTAKELDTLVAGWVEEHKQKRLMGEGKEEQDFMDVMLKVLDESRISGFDADTINKATCLNLILAGSDTTMVTLTWALSLLLNNRYALQKAQDELNIHVGSSRLVDESDINNLIYLQAIVKETLRLYPPVPVIGLRSALDNCTLSSGHRIPANTRLMINAWKIQRDERVWTNPHEFQPERFLTSHKDTDVRGQNFELIPFGSGRRSCPGISLALQVVHYILASLLHCFEVNKLSNEDVDMTESNGLTNLKASPLEVILAPRLDSKVVFQEFD